MARFNLLQEMFYLPRVRHRRSFVEVPDPLIGEFGALSFATTANRPSGREAALAAKGIRRKLLVNARELRRVAGGIALEGRLYRGWKDLGHIPFQAEAHVRFAVVFGRSLVDDDVGHTALRGD